MNTPFDVLELHDATLIQIQISWLEKKCSLALKTLQGNAELVFFGVADVHVPIENPWGRSVSINGQSMAMGVYSIEMQSGDLVKIKANDFSFFLGEK